ncbi:MAG: metallophosphoesterase [Flavobacteriales bacterium]|nr:metallophosphoesterase [Flavobacteriales bacterium]
MSTLRRQGRRYRPANKLPLAILLFCLNASIVWAQKIAAIGDYGVNDINEASVATLVKSFNPDFVITIGDNNYPFGAAETIDQNIGQYYQEYIYPYNGIYGNGDTVNRFYPILGNHDVLTQNGQPYLDYFTLPGNERYYHIIKGDVHLFALNSNPSEPDDIDSNSVQAQWLKDRLAASTAKWKIVYLHHAPYSSCSNHGSTPVMQWPFQQWGASAVIGADDHTYERLMVNGFPYFVNGLGGCCPYEFGDPLMGSVVRYSADFGAMLIDANRDSITFKFINISNELIDCFTLGGKNASCFEVVCEVGESHLQVAPNPVNGNPTIQYCVFEKTPILLSIYNSNGEVIETLVDNNDHDPGQYLIKFNASNIAAGIYFCELRYGNVKYTKRLVVVAD